MLASALGWPRLGIADTGVPPYQEFNQNIQAAQSVSALTDSLFGDSVSLYTGAAHFANTDVSLPGNSGLPVEIRRRLVVHDRTQEYQLQVYQRPYTPADLGGFADWDLDVPWVEGTFVAEDGWTVATTGNPNNRCSVQAVPNTYYSLAGGNIWLADVWHGNQLHIPGVGSQELLVNNQGKSPAYASHASYPWITSGGYKLGCAASLDDGTGEGFIAVSPSGVTYTFNHMIVRAAPGLKEPRSGTTNGYIYVPRSHIYLVATEVQDRFGNWVKYAWSGDHLTAITSSDGRSITLNWSGSTISSVTSAAGTWTYQYGTASGADANGTQYSWPYLSSVTRPDGSKWNYSYNGGMFLTPAASDDLLPNQYGCQTMIAPEPSGSFGYTIDAPSGASAAFQFAYALHHRDLVPHACTGTTAYPTPPPDTNYPMVYSFFENFTIASKTITGPGLPSGMTWKYDYSALEGHTAYAQATQPWNYDDTTQPYIPPVSCSGCGTSADVVVTGPAAITRYAFGIDYAQNEGRLLGKETETLTGTPVRSTTYTYVSNTQASSEPFANIAGQDLLPNYISPMGNRNRPVVKTVISQDGATFTTAVNSFDAFARATSETESSSLGYSKTDTTTYADDLSRWVLGMATQSATNGIVSSQTNYDSLDQPTSQYAFGKLASTKAWNGDGTLASISDGDGHITSFSGWTRGLPTKVTFADGTSKSATINGAGWITALTDENGFTTNYAYDPMGRLAQISYPSGDNVAWNPTLLSFTQVAGAEFGIPGGHWKQVVHTGNGYAVTYFDAFWRPLVVEHYDAGNESGTLSQVVNNYDAGGRKVFTSYPTRSATSYTQALSGTHMSYDALGRLTQSVQDSELGGLPTTTQYLSGFQTEITDPNGNSTLTSYEAFGSPSTQWPVSIAAPAGQLTKISRDVFGKPLSVTRTGTAAGSPSLTRAFVYNTYQELCGRTEPETGTTAYGYDGAGNLVWSASGLAASTGCYSESQASSSGRMVTRSYDARNRVTAINYPNGFSNTQYGYAADGALLSASVSNGGYPATTTYSYDKRRLLTQETLSLPSTHAFSIGYGYDANGHLAANAYPDSRTVAYAPNALGQPTEAGSYATNVQYYPNGSITSFTYGSGAVHTMTEDERGLVDRATDALNGTAGMDFGYNYDSDGNVAAITDYLPGNVGNVDMTYDALDRLTEADSPMFGGSGKALYSYDVLGNLRSAAVGNQSSFDYAYNSQDQLAALTDPSSGTALVNYQYDAQGNLASKNSQAYQFDMADRLKAVPGIATYRYDASGRRVQKSELTTGTLLDSQYSKAGQLLFQWYPATQSATDYIFLGDTLVAKVVGNSSSVIGNIDGVSAASTPTITGWACSTGITTPISVEVYAGGPAGKGGTRIETVTADQPSESAVAAQCQTSGTTYRFSIPLSTAIRSQYPNAPIYMYGDSPVGNSNNELSGSGNFDVPVNPSAPTEPASISVPARSNSGNFTISWAASSGATSYVLKQTLAPNPAQVYAGASTSYAVSGLGNGSYEYAVQACNANGCSSPTTSSTLTVALIPAPPASINAPASSYSPSIAVSWSASANATNYVLEESVNGGGWGVINSGDVTSYTAAVPSSGTYRFQVSACGAGGCSGFTASGNVAITLPPASAPSLSGPSSSTTGTYTLTWTTVAGATRYQLNQSVNGGAASAVYNATGTSWSSSVAGNGTYVYQVYACNAAGCSPSSATVTVNVVRIPSTPTLSGPSSSRTGGYTLTWTASSGATSYHLNWRVNGGTEGLLYNGAAQSYAASHMGNGTYAYQVQACNTTGCSVESNTVTVTVNLVSPCTQAVSAGSAGSLTEQSICK